MKKLFPLILFIMLLISCASTRVVYVPAGSAMQLREDVKKVKVWAFDKDGQRVPGVVDLHEGWYVLERRAKKSN